MTPRRITSLPSRLRLLTDDTLPTSRAIYEGAVSARFPAHQINNIWHTHEEDDAVVMAALGLRPKVAEPSRTRRAAERTSA